ncbi:endo-alpha-N-acetylgalactosaminidase family protein [Paenibacillus chungangensis]|uniref:Endo-alpha-N-acetylgalactosaminidase family protein n=1 Tax=Paenibacillus chungangensis TaxID=696535 RepID=A0ABW3HTI2_9BACL
MKKMTESSRGTEAWRSIPGDMYDWKKTMQPETPYRHDYSQKLTMKLFLSEPDGNGGSAVYCTFSQALRYIEETDQITRGIPKVVYLVGWQYNGHDDQYPAWDEVNERLKRPQDRTARDSYLWLVEEARKHHTTISVHANMTDAYDDSPLWEQYVKEDLLARHEDGSLMQIGVYNNRAAYHICPKREWESGMSVKRIDKLIQLLELDKSGTVHLDAYFPRNNAYHGISEEEESAYIRRVIRYFNQRGVDVTSENFNHKRDDPFIGLQAWSWVLDQCDERHYLERPASLASGGVIRDYSTSDIPFRRDLEFLFGAGMHGEGIYLEAAKGGYANWHGEFIEQFCLRMLYSLYLNRLDRLRMEGEGEERIVHYSGDHTVSLADRTLRCDGRLLRDGDDMLLPASWRQTPELIAFSKSGYSSKSWLLPSDWTGIEAVDLYEITVNGLKERKTGHRLEAGKLTLALEPGMAVSVVPCDG